MSYIITDLFIPLIRSGLPYSHTLSTSGTGGTKTFSVTGALPTNISFNTATGELHDNGVGNYPDDDLDFYLTFEVYDGGVPSGNPQAYHVRCIRPLDTAKNLLVLHGNSWANSSGITNPKLDGIKPRLARLLPGWDICPFGRDGQEAPNILLDYQRFGRTLFNSARPLQICVGEAGINDVAFSGLNASQIATRLQTLVNAFIADGFKGGICTIPAWDTGTANDTLRLATNTNVLAGGFTADFKVGLGEDSNFNAPADAHNTKVYQGDFIHATSYGLKLWAHLIVRGCGGLSGLPLTPVWDFKEETFKVGTDYIPDNIPWGRQIGDTFEWFVNNVSFSTSETPTFNFSTGGNKTIRLEITPTVGAMVSLSRTFFVASAGDVGGGSISPPYSEIVYNGNVVLTPSGIASPIWRVRQGSGSLSGAGSTRTYTDASPHIPALVEAAQNAWNTPSLGSINSNQQWDMTGGGGTPTATLIPQITGSGVRVDLRVPSRNNADVSTGSTFRLGQFAITGYWWGLNLKTNKIQSFVGSSVNDAGTLTGLAADEIVSFHFLPSGEVQILRNGVYQFSCADNVPNYGFALTAQCYDDLGKFLWHRPDWSGDNVGSFAAGGAVIVPQTAPTAGFSIPTDADASDRVNITDSASGNPSTYEYYVDDVLRAAGTNPNPDLRKWLTNDNGTDYIVDHEIKQKVINNMGEDMSAPQTITIHPKYILTGNVTTHILDELVSGLKVKQRIQSIDGNNNPSDWSNFITTQTP